ncbi:MAG: hypothetical protein Q9215_003190 [Flavoplaca cf. flavocitrina]
MHTHVDERSAMNGTKSVLGIAFGGNNLAASEQHQINEHTFALGPEVTSKEYEPNVSSTVPHSNGIYGNGNLTNSSTGTKANGTNGALDADFNVVEIGEGDSKAPPPIAIVGMGMRLPGGVNDEAAFWELLVNKKNGQSVVPEDRYNIEAFYNPDGGPGTVKTKYGYFLNQVNLQHLDTSFFSMNRSEVERLDPQQRLLLEVVWECMENGGQVGWRGKRIGCYVGVFGEDWLDMAAKDTQHLGMYRITGSGDFAISNRVSYEYDLKGPRYFLHD